MDVDKYTENQLLEAAEGNERLQDEIKKLFTLHKMEIIEEMEEGKWKGFMLKCTG